jgi:hypothetical protein
MICRDGSGGSPLNKYYHNWRKETAYLLKCFHIHVRITELQNQAIELNSKQNLPMQCNGHTK